uniref:Alkaline ceramidase n=1 Tax=Scleropages formosus TaxID=113540 RepID=A0A8C9WMS8_SCLFO
MAPSVSHAHSDPSPPGGFWGPPTSTLDWCEENYFVSVFVAEFWNTVSNLLMILPPIYGAIRTSRDGLETRYVFAFLGLAAVGVGSWSFHMTLQYEMQLLDELPMIYSCCIFVYLLWTEPVFHQVMYGVLVFCLVLRSMYVVTWVYPWLRPLCYTSLGVFLLGFILWNVDNLLCDTLRAARLRLPPVIGAVTQFHAWWHIFTGFGSHLHILLSLQTRATYLKRRPRVKVRMIL